MPKIILKVAICWILIGVAFIAYKVIRSDSPKFKNGILASGKLRNKSIEEFTSPQNNPVHQYLLKSNPESDHATFILASYDNILKNKLLFWGFDLSNYFIPLCKTGIIVRKKQTIKDTAGTIKLQHSQTITLNNFEIDILQNKTSCRGDILVLPGWNFSRKAWCNSTQLCTKALQKGYRLILPEMGKSIYATQYFPESRKEWRKYPTLSWVTDTMIPYLQKKYGVFTGEQNYLVGLSTGARGVILIAIKTGALFKAGAALSGDYDQTKMPNDNLMTAIYGPYKTFSARWHTMDNPTEQIDQLNIPIYFGHGLNDKIVPCAQTKNFYDLLRQKKPDLKFVFSNPNHGHDFKYWGSEVDNILDFIESQ